MVRHSQTRGKYFAHIIYLDQPSFVLLIAVSVLSFQELSDGNPQGMIWLIHKR